MADHDWQQITGPTGFKSMSCTVCDVYVSGWTPPADAKPCPGPLVVNVRLEGHWSLKVGQIWPDGDYPDEITAEAVAAAMRDVGSYSLHEEWDLRGDILVSIAGEREPEVKVDL